MFWYIFFIIFFQENSEVDQRVFHQSQWNWLLGMNLLSTTCQVSLMGQFYGFTKWMPPNLLKKINSSMVRKILVKKLEVSCSYRNSKILSGRLYCCHVLCSFTFLQVPCNITFHWKEKLHFYIQRKKEIISFSFLKAGYVWMRKCSLTVKGNVKTVSVIYFTSKCESYSTHIVTISSQTPSKPSNNFFPNMRSAINLHEKTILFIIVTK